jgi:hypothetical protein
MFQYLLAFFQRGVSPFNYVHGIFWLLVCPFAFTYCSRQSIFFLSWQDGNANLMPINMPIVGGQDYYWFCVAKVPSWGC